MSGYTKEDIKRILGTSWPTMPEDHETGAGAVIAVAVAGLGLVEVTDFGFAKTGKHVEQHRDYFKNILHPAMVRSNWLGPDYINLEGQSAPEWIKDR